MNALLMMALMSVTAVDLPPPGVYEQAKVPAVCEQIKIPEVCTNVERNCTTLTLSVPVFAVVRARPGQIVVGTARRSAAVVGESAVVVVKSVAKLREVKPARRITARVTKERHREVERGAVGVCAPAGPPVCAPACNR